MRWVGHVAHTREIWHTHSKYRL